ncbi:hypothetical protein [Phascolarctobacterium faecium]|uniref:hypothetical protein n=1 Tax=Phascolarctobacterium faecium TaxID=33025 RepID=UPI003AB90C97
MKNKQPFIIEIIIGAMLLGVSILIKSTYYSTMLWAMGIGLMVASAVQLVRIIYWENPKRNKEYEAKKREIHINCVDERKQYLRMKAGHITYQIMTFLLLILSLIFALIRVDAWVIAMIFLLFVFQWLVGLIVFRLLEKKL